MVSQLVLLGIWLTTGCGLFRGTEATPQFAEVALEPVSKSPVGSEATGPGSLIGRDRFAVGDLVLVNFSGVDASVAPAPHEERIKDDGNITLPLIGAVKAKDKTSGDLQREILNLYVPKYYNSNLTVTVKGQERVFFVRGQVRSPGRVVYTGEITVTKAISSVGDFTDFANKKNVQLTRADGRIFTVNCVKALQNPALDLQVFPGDQIVVKQKWW